MIFGHLWSSLVTFGHVWSRLVTFASGGPAPDLPVYPVSRLKFYHSQKKKKGKEKVKFWMLYQALTKVGPLPGKEKVKCDTGIFCAQSTKMAKKKNVFPSVFFASFARPKTLSNHTLTHKTGHHAPATSWLPVVRPVNYERIMMLKMWGQPIRVMATFKNTYIHR
jgi:hypothetical protein